MESSFYPLTPTKMTITTIIKFKRYPKKIAQLFRRKRWKNRVVCQKCGSVFIKLHQKLENGIYKYRCRDCHKIFSDLTGTIFEATKIPLWKWIYTLLEFIPKSGINSIELAGKISVNQKTAWRMLTAIRKSLLSYQPSLQGQVEGDESYFGGRQKGKKGRPTRWSNKTCVAGVVERKGNVCVDIIETVDEPTLTNFVEQNVMENSEVFTDGFGAYNALPYAGFVHYSIDHNKEFVRGKIHTQTIEGFWSFIKRKLRGIYYRPSATHLLLYLQEYVFRYNHREFSPQGQFSSLLSFALKAF